MVHFTNIFYASLDGQKVGEAMLWLPRKPQFQKTSRDRACGFRKGVMRTLKVQISVRCSARSVLSSLNGEAGDFPRTELQGCWPLGCLREGGGWRQMNPGSLTKTGNAALLAESYLDPGDSSHTGRSHGTVKSPGKQEEPRRLGSQRGGLSERG